MTNNSCLLEIINETISLNFHDHDFCVKSLAEIVGISISYLREILYAEYDVCPQKIIEFFRLKDAVNLLSSTEYPIYHISKIVGYSNSKTFRSAFKKNIGCTPSEYRNMGFNNANNDSFFINNEQKIFNSFVNNFR